MKVRFQVVTPVFRARTCTRARFVNDDDDYEHEYDGEDRRIRTVKQEEIWRQLAALPPEAQQQVLDFIALLHARYAPSDIRQTTKRTRLASEPFVGMWRDREDLQDSSAWVRSLREREWINRRD
jgi:hypothetical protein